MRVSAGETSRRGVAPSCRTVRAVVALVIAVLLSSCTSSEKASDPALGNDERNEDVAALGMAAVTDGSGLAVVVGTLSNRSERAVTLVGASVTDAKYPVEVTMPDGAVEVPAEDTVMLSPDRRIMLDAKELREGFLVDLLLDFDGAPDLRVELPIKWQAGAYADIEIRRPGDGDVAPPQE